MPKVDCDAEQVGWGYIDDETLALYAAGTCSPQERARVEAAMQWSPDIREIVEDIRQRGFIVPTPSRPRRGRRFWVLMATAVLTCLAIASLLSS